MQIHPLISCRIGVGDFVAACLELIRSNYPFALIAPFFNSTNKRAECRAPVWGSEFTSRAATLQGGRSEELIL